MPGHEDPTQEAMAEGHLFEISIQMWGVSRVVGDPTYTQSDWTLPPHPVYVRAWSLKQALEKAAELPLDVWFPDPEEKDDGTCTFGCLAEGYPLIECDVHGITCDVDGCMLVGQHQRHQTHGIEVLASGSREVVVVGTKEEAETAAEQCHPDRNARVVELFRYHGDGTPRRSKECAERNPEDHPYWDGCCRFPKSCSPVPYAETPVKPTDLEPRRP